MGLTIAAESVQTEHASIAEAVVTAVAATESVDAHALSPRLYDVIDPDTLDTLCANNHDSVAISFTYGDWTVDIADGVM